jgi:hypothetical protein
LSSQLSLSTLLKKLLKFDCKLRKYVRKKHRFLVIHKSIQS